MSGLRISEALIFCSIRSLYAYLRHALCLGRCLPTTVAVAPQSWVMDISAPSGLSLCDVCMVLRWGVAVCACVVVVGQCAWVKRRWRFMFVERVGAMGLCAYLRHALCLGRCLPTTVAVAPQSWVMDISAPPGLSLCDVCMVLRWGVAVCACVVVVGQCVCVGGLAFGASCLWSELARWGYARTFGTLSAWGLCTHDRRCAPQSWVMDISALRGCVV